MNHKALTIVVLLTLASSFAGCTVRYRESTNDRTRSVENDVATTVDINCTLDGNRVLVKVEEVVRTEEERFRETTRTRTWASYPDDVITIILSELPTTELLIGLIGLPKRDSVALGPLGFLAAVVLPGVTMNDGRGAGRKSEWVESSKSLGTRVNEQRRPYAGKPVDVECAGVVRRTHTDRRGMAVVRLRPLADQLLAKDAIERQRLTARCGSSTGSVTISTDTWIQALEGAFATQD